MKRKLCVFLLLTLGISTYAQDVDVVKRDSTQRNIKRVVQALAGGERGTNQLVQSIAPLSPQTATLFRFTEYPVSPATGIPDITVPIYDIKLDGVNVPINLSYHASGIKVNDIASPVGLGWVLNAGGAIGRMVNSMPDYFSPSRVKSASELDDARQHNSYSCDTWRHMVNGDSGFDTESDRYIYNFAGKTGCFRYDFSTMTIKPIPYVPLKISEIGSMTAGYKIVDSDGAEYYFTQKESTGPSGSMVYTAYYLTKIITPTTKDSIVFTYQTGTMYAQALVSEYAHKGDGYEKINYATIVHPGEEHSEIIVTAINYSTPLIKTIKWLGNTVSFTYDTNRPEYNLQKERLTKITVTNSNGNVIRMADIGNTGVLGGKTYNKRMLLNNVRIYGNATDSEAYSFTYNNNPLPDYNYANVADKQCHEDYWGYYNGTSSIHFVPSDYQISSQTPGTNRRPNYTTAQYGILTSVTYPTGGKTEFAYEGNVIGSDNWGGLRVKSIIHKEGTTQISKTVYSYSGGKKSMQLEGQYRNVVPYVYYIQAFVDGPFRATSMHTVVTSNPILPLTGWSGNPVFYSNIKETYYDGNNNIDGSRLRTYMEDRVDIGSCGDIENDPWRFYSQLYNCDEGCVSPLLVSERQYKGSSSSPSQTIQYDYTTVTRPSFPLGVRIYKGDVEVVSEQLYGGGNHNDMAPYSSWSEFYESFHYHDVYGFPSFRLLLSVKTTDHEANFSTTEEYGYDTQYRTLKPIMVKTSTSDGSNMTENRLYSFNYSSGVNKSMYQANYADRVIQTQIKKGTQVVSTLLDTYISKNGRFLRSAISLSVGSASPEIRTRITDYSIYGNICGITQDDSYNYAIVWSYKHQYPVAILEGCTYSQLVNKAGQTLLNRLLDATSPAASDLTSLRNAANSLEAQITTYEYVPLAGLTEETEPGGITKSYGYDTLWRLISEKDSNGDILMKYSYALGGSRSYIKTEKRLNASGTSLSTFEYLDGLGRPVSTATNSLSSSWVHNIVSYDGMGRLKNKWLPVVSSSQNYQSSANAASLAQSTYSDNQAYSQYSYDGQSRLITESTPGKAWKDASKNNTVTYRANTSGDAVVKYLSPSSTTATPSSSGTYAAGTLMVEISKDEDGKTISVFKDRQGRVVLERRGTESNTYYVYNDLGQLRFVVPPQGTGVLYEYRYDGRGRCKQKKLPQCDYIEYWYDSADRMIGMQDGVMKNQGKYRFYLYDKIGRLAVQGICSSLDTSGSFVVTFQSSGGGLGNTGYVTGKSFKDMQLELVNYYDNYGFLQSQSSQIRTHLAAGSQGWSDAVLPSTTNPSGKGRQTGTIVYQMPYSGANTVTTFYYGLRGRLVQTHSSNHLSGYEDEYLKYSFTDQVTQRKHVHTKGSSTTTELYTNTYNSQDRLSQTDYKLNSNAAVTLAKYEYNNLGLLQKRKVAGTIDMTYAYNVRSWLTNISSTRFTEQIAYNATNGNAVPSTACYNGNIAAISWKAGSETAFRTAKFTYNNLDWLTGSTYSGTGKYTTSYTYDKMGNIKTIQRNGLQDGSTYGLIDNLTFTYTGNQVTKIEDAVNDPTYNGAFNFNDGVSQSGEYAYDKNGNMTKDLNKKISSIKYNFLNLPSSITYSTGKSATYIYDASGMKLRTSYKASSSATAQPTDYCGNMIYENNVLKQILIDGGYITFNGSTPVYHYYLQDHQGNNRVVCNASGTVEQVNHYYPFGGLYGQSTNGDTQRFKYNGKELDRMHGLDLYDYGARHYDAAIGRFTTVDPMAEKYYHLSPYAYCANNPVNNIDLRGDSITYVCDGVTYTYKKVDGQYGFYSVGGLRLDNLLSNALLSALDQLREGKNGREMVEFLSGCNTNVRIDVTSNDNEMRPSKNGVAINWNPDDYEGGVDEYGKTMNTPPFVNLAHELYHAEDFILDGVLDKSVWYTSPNGTTPRSEYEACLFENKIRAEHGLPFRKYYANYMNSDRPYEPSVIPIYTINPTNVWQQRRNFYKLLPKRL